MRLPGPLIPARLVRRYKRFLADVVLEDGTPTTVHCPNPGRMIGLDGPGSRVWLSRAKGAKRRLPLTLEFVETAGGLVGINTMHPNRLVEEAIRAGRIPELDGYAEIRREVAYEGKSRVDLVLRAPDRPDCYVEVKNVHLKRGAEAEFPDAVTTRGVRHLDALRARVLAGDRAIVFYVVQRADCAAFCVAEDIDPGYAAAFRRALDGGVESLCHACALSLEEIRLAAPLPIVV